jgi:hypothetical protein
MPPESHRDAISQIRASQKLPPSHRHLCPWQSRNVTLKRGRGLQVIPTAALTPTPRKTFDAAVKAGHDVRSLSLPGGLSAGEVAILGPVGDPPCRGKPGSVAAAQGGRTRRDRSKIMMWVI